MHMNKVLLFVNVDWFFLSHRLPIAKEASKKGINMNVFADFTRPHEKDEYQDFNFFKSPIKRTSNNIFSSFKELINTFNLVKKEKPKVVQAVTVKPILFLGIICFILRIPFIASISGLGPAFTPKNFLSRFVLSIIKLSYKIIFSNENSLAICQSNFDASVLIDNNLISRKRVYMAKGSGINLDKYYSKKNINHEVVNILMASRLLKDKGVKEFCSASGKIIRNDCFNVNFSLAGPFDKDSPSALKEDEVLEMCKHNNIKFLGNRTDIQDVLAETDIFVLPSYYGEGIPKVLLEAAASRCAVITTDHPGCRDAIIPNETGILVKPKDISSLTDALILLLSNPEKIELMGSKARELAKEQFSVKKVVDLHYDLYQIFINGSFKIEK